MALKIQCPECRHEMSLKTFKAGRFKPTCTQCKRAFALVIGPGDPPEVKIAKLSTDTKVEDKKPSAVTQIAADETLAQESTREATRHGAVDVAKPDTIHANEQTVEHVSRATHVQTSPTPSSHANTSEVTSEITKATSKPASKPSSDTTGDATLEAPSIATAVASKPAGSIPTRHDGTGSHAASMPERLGGYRILKELGRGGMGAVYLAKQLSLDRNVAVKTIQNNWSGNPRVVARFIREAYAAAQLTHHNVVQIYDLGQDSGINYFSMELVEGGSLDDLLKSKGRLQPKQAATYILHAARGLRFAHDHGMIHRDIKPANLMLTTDALVKVADLGLVKTPSPADDEQDKLDADANVLLASARSHVTGAGSALGTPAYMSPEQAEDATSVDHRADIYSLGCTFYALLIGKPPFANRSAVEILSRIKSDPIERVDSLVEDIPRQLASLVEKMTAKEPADRFQSLDEVVLQLEQFLNESSDEPRQRADTLKQIADQLQGLPTNKLRKLVPAAVGGLLLVGMLLGLLFSWRFSVFCGLCLVMTPLFTILLNGLIGERSPLTQRARAFLLGSSLGDWITWALGALVVLVVFGLTGLFVWGVAALLVSMAIAAGIAFGIARNHQRQCQPLVDRAKEVIRDMRLQGKDESSIAAFISEFAGKHWEGLLEKLLGYETLRAQRAAQSGARKSGSWLPSWRDLLVDRLDARINEKREQREQRMLAKVEAASLQAAGASKKEAEEQAAAMATSLVSAASQTRQLIDQSGSSNKLSPEAKRERVRQMMASARSGKPQTKLAKASRATGQLLNQLLGGKLRFAIGALLLVGCALWANQNGLFDKEKLSQVGSALQSSAENLSKSATDLQTGQEAATKAATKVGQQVGNAIGKTRPLDFPVIGSLFSSFAPGVIGLFILLSAFVGTWRWTIAAALAAAIALLGTSFVPSFGLDQGAAWLSCAVGAIVLALPILIKPLR